MTMDKIIEKLKDVLSEDDLKSFEQDIKSLIDEKVSIKVEAEKKELEKISEEYCQIKIEETVKKVSELLIKEYDEKLDLLESNIIDKLDKFIDLEISQNISEDTLKSIAINETYAPIIDGIKHLFEKQYVGLDTEGYGLLKDYTERIEELEDQLSESIASKMELEETVDIAAAKLLISQKTEHLTESEKKKVFDFFDGKGLVETKSKLDSFVDLILEKEDVTKTSNTNKDVMTEDTGITSEEDLIQEDVIDYSKKDESLKSINSSDSLLELASRYV